MMAVDGERVQSDANYDAQTLLWVGNIDIKRTEFKLLKVVERFGKLAKFDYLLHQRGPDAGKPRGYAFIAYERPEDAKRALAGLQGFRFGDRHLSVHFAHERSEEEARIARKPGVGSAAAANQGVSSGRISKTNKPPNSDRKLTIAAIEAKLKAMERGRPAGALNVPTVGPGGRLPVLHQFRVIRPSSSGSSSYGYQSRRPPRGRR